MNYIMKKYYLTFGQAHPLRNGYVEVVGRTEELASRKAFEIFGPHFGFIRPENVKDQKKFFPHGKFGETLYADNY